MLRELIDEGRKMKSIVLYKQGKVSSGLGAKIAKLSMSEYIDLLKEYKIAMNLPTAELWGILMSKTTDVALTYPNRSRAAGYYN